MGAGGVRMIDIGIGDDICIGSGIAREDDTGTKPVDTTGTASVRPPAYNPITSMDERENT